MDTFSIKNATKPSKEDALSVFRIVQLLKLIFKRTKKNQFNFNLRSQSKNRIREKLNKKNVKKCPFKWILCNEIERNMKSLVNNHILLLNL